MVTDIQYTNSGISYLLSMDSKAMTEGVTCFPNIFHRQQIRDARVRILYVSNHIANCARFQPVKFSILPLYKMQTDCVSARKIKEKHFIGLFKPKLNKSI